MIRRIFLLFLFPLWVLGQPSKYVTERHSSGEYTFETVTNDPLKTRIYTLKNGLKVYMTVYKDAPRIQTYIAVRAGSKNDPATNTGLAHYLEHILFKGTSKIGTKDWAKEEPLLKEIENLYEAYRTTRDENQRTRLYQKIDSTSLLAANFSIPNEYDKMLSNIGATGTNAYTFLEQTVYVNDIPSNSLERWAEIESERFSIVVPRLFHTELEAVYEEKNRGLDNDRRKVYEAMMAGLFQKHQYGTQTTIGTVEHLKNPSITEIKRYFERYYVPNNMAICMSGDFDPEKAIRIIDKSFSKLKEKAVSPFVPPTESPIKSPEKINVYGPDAENLTMAFRFNGIKGQEVKQNFIPDFYYLKLISLLLTNGQAGLIDLNLNQRQKVLSAFAYDMALNDYSIFVMGGRPKQGQSLEDLKILLLAQLDSLKKGKFEEWLIKASINDIKMSQMKSYESNKARADAFVESFITGEPWKRSVEETDILSSITKEQIIEFVKQRFDSNYVAVYKFTGTDTTIKKVPKPQISPVPVNREDHSPFFEFVMNQPSDSIKPVWIDFNKELLQFQTKTKLPVTYKKNTENDIFTLSYVWDIGREHSPKYGLAVSYLDYLGVKGLSSEELKKEFYKIGCSYSFSMSADAMYFTLTGLQENFSQGLKLFEKILKTPQEDPGAYKDLVERSLKARKDNKLNKDIIFRSGLVSYAKYGPHSPFTSILSEEQLRSMNPSELTDIIKSLNSIKHRVLYYGPTDATKLNKSLTSIHKCGTTLEAPPAPEKFTLKDINENEVLWANYEMVQGEVIFLSKSITYDKTILPRVALFNEYFGGSMSSIVFQELRESRALAYAVKSRYENAWRKDDPNYISSYIGTQADKIKEAIDGMLELYEDMPQSEVLFKNAVTSIIENVNTQRITKFSVISEYERLKKLGINYDIRKEVYEKIKTLSLSDLKDFHDKYYRNQKKAYVIIGSKDRIDFEKLSKYGKVRELKLEELFGY
ncbi:zinc protease [Sporocytophaga myxococcoides]|uniref:Zinc protease n=1 Tax=Sporocytophaga myxococcoides TaxID=153721 RepID=A0A098L8A1_9BACT|nr:M16 family metallopeptidase [Sporocytophaga myxococcoides]GAL82885.1 zinc protease [Sporocytophaga myxococcoides]